MFSGFAASPPPPLAGSRSVRAAERERGEQKGGKRAAAELQETGGAKDRDGVVRTGAKGIRWAGKSGWLAARAIRPLPSRTGWAQFGWAAPRRSPEWIELASRRGRV